MAERSLNQVKLIGRLGKDPELRTTAKDTPVCKFPVVTTLRWKTPDGKEHEETERHQIIIWGQLGENAHKYLQKGHKVYLAGRNATRAWKAPDGTERTVTEVFCYEMILLDGPVDGLQSNENC